MANDRQQSLQHREFMYQALQQERADDVEGLRAELDKRIKDITQLSERLQKSAEEKQRDDEARNQLEKEVQELTQRNVDLSSSSQQVIVDLQSTLQGRRPDVIPAWGGAVSLAERNCAAPGTWTHLEERAESPTQFSSAGLVRAFSPLYLWRPVTWGSAIFRSSPEKSLRRQAGMTARLRR